MTTYRMPVIVEVDDDLLGAHDGEDRPPLNEVEDWYGGDLQAAIQLGIAEIVHEPIDDVEKLEDET